jgi:hypothetical protein
MGLTLTATKTGKFHGGSDLSYWCGKAAFDAAYATAGEVLGNEDFSFTSLYSLQCTPDFLTTTTALVVVYDWSASLLMLFESGADGAALDEIGTDNVSALVVDLFAVGQG